MYLEMRNQNYLPYIRFIISFFQLEVLNYLMAIDRYPAANATHNEKLINTY